MDVFYPVRLHEEGNAWQSGSSEALWLGPGMRSLQVEKVEYHARHLGAGLEKLSYHTFGLSARGHRSNSRRLGRGRRVLWGRMGGGGGGTGFALHVVEAHLPRLLLGDQRAVRLGHRPQHELSPTSILDVA